MKVRIIGPSASIERLYQWLSRTFLTTSYSIKKSRYNSNDSILYFSIITTDEDRLVTKDGEIIE